MESKLLSHLILAVKTRQSLRQTVNVPSGMMELNDFFWSFCAGIENSGKGTSALPYVKLMKTQDRGYVREQ